MSTRYNNGSHYENHQRAAELHDAAAHAHRVAEARGNQPEPLTGPERSRQALEHSQQAHARTRAVVAGRAVAAPYICGPSCGVVLIAPRSSRPTTWRRTPCGRWRITARTGCTWAARSGPKVAAILSVVESCRRLGLPVKEYLLAVLPGMSQKKPSEAARLTPPRWKASQPSRWSADRS